MGAEREDTDPKRVGTEPGLGRPSSGETPAAVAQPPDDEPAPVDFDALHAALGDPLDYEELPSGPAVDKGSDEPDELLDGLESAPGKDARGGDSSGRSSATYASARPHTIPPTRPPNEDLNAPPVIVASDDTVPSAPPQMTVPLTKKTMQMQPHAAPPFVPPPGASPSGPHGAAPGNPSSGSHPAAPGAFVQTPPPFPALPRGMHQMTMRMPERPVNPRRQKTPTLVVRARGPSWKQKLVVFMLLLAVVAASGIGWLLLTKPSWLALGPGPGPSALPSASPSASPAGGAGTHAPGTEATAASSAPAAASAASPASSASAKKAPAKPR